MRERVDHGACVTYCTPESSIILKADRQSGMPLDLPDRRAYPFDQPGTAANLQFLLLLLLASFPGRFSRPANVPPQPIAPAARSLAIACPS